MAQATGTTILIVANRTASTPALLADVERRHATAGGFGLMIPPEAKDNGNDWTEEEALRLVGRAAHGEVAIVEPGTDAAATIHDLVADGTYGEIILSTVPEHHARWHHHKLPDRIQRLGIPVTVIPPDPDKGGRVEGFPDEWGPHAVSPGAVAGFGNY
jgi:hypothetical protein